MINVNGVNMYTSKEVAKILGVTNNCIWVWHKNGLLDSSMQIGKSLLFSEENIKNRKLPNKRGQPGILEDKTQEMIDLYKSGKTLSDIGIKFGLTRERIRQRLSSHGIKREDGGK